MKSSVADTHLLSLSHILEMYPTGPVWCFNWSSVVSSTKKTYYVCHVLYHAQSFPHVSYPVHE